MADFEALLLHAPSRKTVEQGVGRLYYLESVAGKLRDLDASTLAELRGKYSHEETLSDPSFLAATLKYSGPFFRQRTEPFLHLSDRAGALRSASLFVQLLSFLGKGGAEAAQRPEGGRLLLFAFGAGVSAALFSLRLDLYSARQKADFEALRQTAVRSEARLDKRVLLEASELHDGLKECTEGRPKQPENLFPGTFYITHIDENGRRFYTRI